MIDKSKIKVLAWGGDAPQTCHRFLQSTGRKTTPWPDRPEARVEVAVVGAGLSGLAAAYDLKDREVLVLEAGSRPGGVCQPGSYQGVSYPAGSAYFYHEPGDQETLAWYRELGLNIEEALVAPPVSALFDQGRWTPDCFSATGLESLDLSPAAREKVLKFAADLKQYEADWDPLATPFMTRPVWDQCSLQDFLENIERLPPEVTAFFEPYCRSCLGAGPDQLSAWAGIYFLMAEFSPDSRVGFFPEGNARLAQALAAHVKNRLRLGQTVVGLKNGCDAVHLQVWDDAEQRPWLLEADMVILATGKSVTRHLLPPNCGWEPELFEEFRYSSYVVAALCGRLSLEAPGFENWVAGEPAFSDFILTPRQAPPGSPRVMVVFAPQPYPGGREALLTRTPEEQGQEILTAVARHFPGIEAEVEEIHLYRYGHAQVVPYPGFIHFLKGRVSPQEGRLVLANSDMEGLPCVEAALAQGRKAARRVRMTFRV